MHTVCFKLIDYKSYNSPTCKIKNNIRTTQIIYSFCWYLGGYGIPAIPTRPSCLSSHRSHRTRRSFWRRRVSHRHIVGGYGILPYPRSPLAYPPTEATKLAEVSGGEEPPTDAHG